MKNMESLNDSWPLLVATGEGRFVSEEASDRGAATRPKAIDADHKEARHDSCGSSCGPSSRPEEDASTMDLIGDTDGVLKIIISKIGT